MLGWRGRVGLVVPANNTVVEPELYGAHVEGVSYHTARVVGSLGGDASVAGLRRIVEGVSPALASLKIAGVDQLVYACLSTSLANPGWEARFGALAQEAVGVPAITAYAATLASMKARPVQRWLIVTPYGGDVQGLVRAAFERDGIDVHSTASLDVPGLQAVCRVRPTTVYGFVRSVCARAEHGVDGVALLATDLQTLAVLEVLGRDLQMPVISTNQAIAEQVEQNVRSQVTRA